MPYNSAFLDFATSGALYNKEEENGNNWHTKQGQQKPSNLDASIHTIKASQYAPFTREQEQPSIAKLYIQQQYGNMPRINEAPEYGMDDAPPFKEEPVRNGTRKPGPEWGNTHFGTKPRRRSVIETEQRAVLDDNAPPLSTFYDELIEKERRQKQIENPVSSNGYNVLHSSNNGNTDNASGQTRVPLFDHPKAVRVSNYNEARWPEVLSILEPYGTILERFEELRKNPYHKPVPARVLAESDDEVVRSARMLFTGNEWTKITFATRASADKVIGLSGTVSIGGRQLIIEPWNPEIHGKPSHGADDWTRYRANSPPNFTGPSTTTGVDSNHSNNLFRRPGQERSIFDDTYLTPANPTAPATPGPKRTNSSGSPILSPGGTMFSTQMKGAKVIQLKQLEGGVFKKQPGMWSRFLTWIWGEVGPSGPATEQKSSGWMTWLTEQLFGGL